MTSPESVWLVVDHGVHLSTDILTPDLEADAHPAVAEVLDAARQFMVESLPLIVTRNPAYEDRPFPRATAPSLLTRVIDLITIPDGPTCQWGHGPRDDGVWELDWLCNASQVTVLYFPPGFDD